MIPYDPHKTPPHGHQNPNELHLICKLNEIIELIGYLHDDIKAISRKVEHHMALFESELAALNAAIASETTQVQTGVADLKAQIAALQAQLAQDTVTPEDRAAIKKALEDATTAVKAIDPSDPTTLPTP